MNYKKIIPLARAKGFDTFYILNRHVLRNVFLSTLYFSKQIFGICYLIYTLLNTYSMFKVFSHFKTYNTELEPAPEIFCVTLF